MTIGFTGNTGKPGIWEPAAALIRHLKGRGAEACIVQSLADGLRERDLLGDTSCEVQAESDLGRTSGLVVSLGGDGTLLRTAHAIGLDGPPILGVNVGRLGFLARAELGEAERVLDAVLDGETGVEERMVLDVEVEGAAAAAELYPWALNDLVVDKSGSASMIQVEAMVDGLHLNTYWADGLILATPTGSTAYALSVGGPIVTPQAEAIVAAPIAPHTLTARPIVLPGSCEIELRVATRDHPYVIAIDGQSIVVEEDDVVVRVRPSAQRVRLVTLPGGSYFATVRSKLNWGQSAVF